MRPTCAFHTPNPHLPTGKIDRHQKRPAVLARNRFDGQGVEIGRRVIFHLPPVSVEGLPEVAFLVKETDADERKAEVGRRFQMVARENAQTAGVNGQAFGDAKFSGEVGDTEIVRELALVRFLPPHRIVHVAAEVGVDRVQFPGKRRIRR